MTQPPSTQDTSAKVRSFELSAQYQAEIMQDLVEQWQAALAEGESSSFAESVNSFYANEMDDLHDSSGDAEYQEGVLERMQFIEQQLAPLLTATFTAEDKLSEAEWARA